MIAFPMIYATLVSLLFGLAAWAAERVAATRDWPRRIVWIATMVVSLVFPVAMLLSDGTERPELPAAERMSFALPEPYPTLSRNSPRTAGAESMEEGEAEAPRVLRFSSPAIDTALKTLWMSASGVLIGFCAVGWIRLQRSVRRLPRIFVAGSHVRVAQRLGPAVFGLLRPQIILPRWILRMPEPLRESALAHEQAHLRAGDPWLLFLALLLLIMTPWNLPLWWQFRRLRFAIEVDCDQRVLRRGVNAYAYCEALLAVAQRSSRMPFGAVALTEPISQLEQRIRIMTVVKFRPARTLIIASSGCALSLLAAAAQLEPPPLDALLAQQSPLDGQRNTIVLARPQQLEASPQLQERARKLKDPQQREVMLAEEKAAIRERSPDLAEILELDPQTLEGLLSLLAEQRLIQLDAFHERLLRSTPPVSPSGTVKAGQDVNRRIAALLGETTLQRYREYEAGADYRLLVRTFNSRLAGSNALTLDQRNRLVALLEEEHEQAQLRSVGSDMFGSVVVAAPTGSLDDSVLDVVLNEQRLREAEDRHRHIVERLPEVLTPQQAASFAEQEESRLRQEREYLSRQRELAGGAGVAQSASEPTDFAGMPARVKLDVEVTIDAGRPLSRTFTGTAGTAFKISPETGNLELEVIPRIYAGGPSLVLAVYERGSSRRRLVTSIKSGTLRLATAGDTGQVDDPAAKLFTFKPTAIAIVDGVQRTISASVSFTVE